MNQKLSTLLGAAVLAVAASSPLTAAAQGTWNLGGSTCNPTTTAPTTATCTVGTVTATMSGWSNTGTGGAFVQTSLTAYDPSGFGTKSNSAEADPQHAFDNITTLGGSVELMLINFSAPVDLASISIGWFSGDADASVYRYTGSGTPSASDTVATNVGTSTASLGSGWALVSSVDVVGTGTAYTNTNPNATQAAYRADLNNSSFSSWWIVSTYLGATTGSGVSKLTPGDDAYKLLGFAATTCAGTVTNGTCGPNTTPNAVPEPGSLAMAGLALAAVWTSRRKRAAPAAAV